MTNPYNHSKFWCCTERQIPRHACRGNLKQRNHGKLFDSLFHSEKGFSIRFKTLVLPLSKIVQCSPVSPHVPLRLHSQHMNEKTVYPITSIIVFKRSVRVLRVLWHVYVERCIRVFITRNMKYGEESPKVFIFSSEYKHNISYHYSRVLPFPKAS